MEVKRRKIEINDAQIVDNLISTVTTGEEVTVELNGKDITKEANEKDEVTDVTKQDNDIKDEKDEVTDATKQEDHIKEEAKWLPSSVLDIESPMKFASSTHHSEVPNAVKRDMTQPVVLGVDEAGRGPVMGPMVYGVAYALESYLQALKAKYGFADSKTLKEDKRRELFKLIDGDDELSDNVGWCTTTMTARDILSGMLQSSSGKGSYNLNEQAHDTTIELIKQVLAKGVNVKFIYVDTVGPPDSYARKLRGHFPGIEITVTKKADSIYPIVSTASVVAKVTRDFNLQFYNDKLLGGVNIGSGYPSDPNTVRWFNNNVDKVFGWCFGLVRFSWQTSKDSLVKNGAVDVTYEDECIPESGYEDIGNVFQKEKVMGKSVFGLTDDVTL